MKLLSFKEWAAYQGAFIALWTDETYAYALYEPGDLVAVALQAGTYPALPYPGAQWFHRLAKDLRGHKAVGFETVETAIEQFRAPDGRGPWPEFVGPDQEGVDQLALGPVYGDITEPAHFRFFLKGERILKLQTRRGYAYRDVLGLIRDKSPRQAARYAARVSGDSTVAHTVAFARAAEIALGLEIPQRAHFLRAIMVEIERLANHCCGLGQIAKIAGFSALEARLMLLREYLASAAQTTFGHRLMMDVVVPGGVTKDIAEAGIDWLRSVLTKLEAELPDLKQIFMSTSGLQSQTEGVGVILKEQAQAYNAGGYIGRGAGVACDARVVPGYPPYQSFQESIPIERNGDVAARIKVRLAEMGASVGFIQKFIGSMPAGPVAVTLPAAAGAGMGVCESFRGPVWYWLKIEHGHIQDVFMADASPVHFELLEDAAMGTNLADFPMFEACIHPSVAAGDG